jgi:uncharacterized protein
MSREIGKVRAIYRYPVKSMAGQVLDSAAVGWHGLVGDRRFAFLRVGVQSGFPWLSASKLPELLRYIPLMPDSDQNSHLPTHVRTPAGQELDIRGESLRQEISSAHGSPVEMVQLDQGVFDEAKVSLIAISTIKAIEEKAGINLEVARFRPNILIETLEEKAFVEDEWVDKIIHIGDGRNRVSLNAYLKDVRCVMINLDPSTSESDSSVLKTVARMNNTKAGAYAMVVKPGQFSVGDRVYLQDE